MKQDLLAKAKSDNESLNQGQNNLNSINMPNTIKYPKSIVNNSIPNNSAPQASSNNKQNDDEANQDKLPKKRISGKLLICLIICVVIYEYYVYVFLLKPVSLSDIKNFSSRFIVVIFFHISVFMMLWCFIVTTKTIPGVIPLYWGFYIGDEEYKRKRYCLICNAFKPERSHHCSVCNICVLNMDHHCPWVNNCIGFYNRKFFMQLLFYLFILLWFITLTALPQVYEILYHCYTTRLHIADILIVKYIVTLPAYILVCILTVLNTMFFKYHVMLVLDNSTTIESLDKDNKEHLKFKLSYSENWAQVFGFETLFWFFPVFAESGRPNGDGLNWKISSAFE
jgi:hypothetical protein